MFLLLLSLSSSEEQIPNICKLCETTLSQGIRMAKKGMPKEEVQKKLFRKCASLKQFTIRLGCRHYVRDNIDLLFAEANKNTMTPYEICKSKGACENPHLDAFLKKEL